MRSLPIVIGTLALVAALSPSVSAQSIDLRPDRTKEEFKAFAGELGSILRFRQLGETTPLGRNDVEIGVQYANTSIDDPISFPRIGARFGVGERADIGVWGGVNPSSNWGFVGVDTKIALLRQEGGRPVSVSIRPSVTSLVGPAEVWVGNASIDLSMSRAFGPVSPYVGVATSGSLAFERSAEVDLDPAAAEASLTYAGVSYRWRKLLVAAEVEKGDRVSYGIRFATRF
jgi:hypothetical protein